MGQVGNTSSGAYVNRFVKSGECKKVDETNVTPMEDFVVNSNCEPGNQDCGSQEVGSPILIDLDRDGFHLTGLFDPVTFDLDADGAVEPTGWTARGSQDAFLALDRNGNGVIDDASELFGNSTPLRGGGTAEHGYQALAELDALAHGGNRDGVINIQDIGFSKLLLWVDSNHNGDSESGELSPLAESPVVQLDLDFRRSERRDRHGNLLRYVATAWLSVRGAMKRSKSSDVFFRYWDH